MYEEEQNCVHNSQHTLYIQYTRYIDDEEINNFTQIKKNGNRVCK